MRRRAQTSSRYICGGCGKLVDDHHYSGWPKSSTPPELIHQVSDPRVPHWAIYHHCGHFTIYNLPDGWPITGPAADPSDHVI